ncbi:response regulator receiver domain-containing protein [Roseivirga pacifica]|uniref:Response regulator receiver domain-containing protein n=1 Tax=Roseivirga pacifica TaxID=1267423 RepID=A0A1I0P2P4_9BACT|nr:response regulator [Roseivirga pacifica]RKQ51669.1 response regulator receiver domain-containing protein [Roseivirga pacifica]SEW08625.1 Response regulator receiver domain-containing protein [Roseivirga pacifica]
MKFRILLVEDSLEDIVLTKLAFSKSNVPAEIDVVNDGEECLSFLRKEEPFTDAKVPDLILLDLNMPKLNGKQVLEVVKTDPELKHIPTVVLSTSKHKVDVEESYERFANSYLAKPIDFNEFLDLVKEIETFWLKIVKLPNSTE